MGTPHRGSKLAQWATLPANAVNAISLSKALRTDLLRELDTGSKTLTDISNQFEYFSTKLYIRSFVETQIEPPLQTLVSTAFAMSCCSLVSISSR